jgi:hypothetical protein
MAILQRLGLAVWQWRAWSKREYPLWSKKPIATRNKYIVSPGARSWHNGMRFHACYYE